MHIYTLYIDDIDRFKFFLFSKMGSYHTSWNPFVSLNEIKWTAFGVTKYRFPHHFSGCGGVATEVERNGNVVRLGESLALIIYLFIGKEDFYTSVVQHQFQVNRVKISASHSCMSADLSSYYLGRNPPPP